VTFSRYTLRPSVRARLLDFLVHHNPFYLLSALCMLAGCYATNSGLAPRTGDLRKLLALIGTLNAYEAMVIALALFLIRRGIIRDGRTLLLLEAPFLVDLAFLNTEAGSVSVMGGLVLNLCILGAALIKVAVITRALYGRLCAQLFTFVAVVLSALFLMPSAFAHFEHEGGVTPAHLYAAWWLIGGLLALYGFQFRIPETSLVGTPDPLRILMRRVYTLLPLASLVVHVSIQHWVYRVDFTGGDLSPLLVGGTAALCALPRRGDVRRLQIVLPLIALSLSVHAPPDVHPRLMGISLTPALITGTAAYAAYVFCFFPRLALPLLGGGAAVTALALFGPTFQQICFTVASAWHRMTSTAHRLLPQTAVEWGMTALGGAFAFLLLGAGISLKKPAPAPEANPE
jgi:hypothetical protein